MNSDLIRKAVEKLPGVRADDNRNSLLARVFQAIRMEVNDEMGQVDTGLKAAVASLRSGGRLCVLSYHSVEDRRVKETLAEFEKDCLCAPNLPVCMCGSNNRQLRKILRKPGLPTEAERDRNPRARSAKLRVMEKVCMKGLKLRTVVGLFFLVLCAAGILVAHVWKQNAYVRLSMSTVKIGKAKAQLQNEIALLEISVGGLKRLSRIEGMAKSRFGLEYGNTPVLVYLASEAGEGKAGAVASVGVETASRAEAKGLEAGKVAWRIKGY